MNQHHATINGSLGASRHYATGPCGEFVYWAGRGEQSGVYGNSRVKNFWSISSRHLGEIMAPYGGLRARGLKSGVVFEEDGRCSETPEG